MSDDMTNDTCVECREEEDAIWIETPWSVKSDGTVNSERLCERCYGHLNVRGGGKSVKGSQWNGEESTGYVSFAT